MTPTDLIKDLNAQLDIIEAAALTALHSDGIEPGVWVVEPNDCPDVGDATPAVRASISEDRQGCYWSVAHDVLTRTAVHIAAHDPKNVLDDVAAKRKIIGACTPDHLASLANGDDSTELATEVLRLLASSVAGVKVNLVHTVGYDIEGEPGDCLDDCPACAVAPEVPAISSVLEAS
jgi:hypothetical protein